MIPVPKRANTPVRLPAPVTSVVDALMSHDESTLIRLRDALRSQIMRVEVELAQIEDALAQKKRAVS